MNPVESMNNVKIAFDKTSDIVIRQGYSEFISDSCSNACCSCTTSEVLLALILTTACCFCFYCSAKY